MVKTIKTNLMCDGFPCRSIEDVQEHFCIEDMLDYYESGLLKSWLEVRGFKKELAEVEAIDATEPLQITEELARIFEIVSDKDKIKEAVFLIDYQKKRQAAYQANKDRGYKSSSVITNYISGYESIVKKMMNRSVPSKVLQLHINTLATDYQPLFEKNIYTLFTTSLQVRPLVCLNLLYNEHSRKFLMPKDKCVFSNMSRVFAEGIDFSQEQESIFRSIQPDYFAPLLFNFIGQSNWRQNLEDLEALFEGQLKVVMATSKKKVFESRGTKCLIVTTYCFNLLTINDNSYGPFQITDGIELYNHYNNCEYPIAYFKVNDE